MKTGNNLQISTSPTTHSARKLRLRMRSLYRSTRRRYTGKERDSETGLHYYGARYLDSKTGRWLSGDPAVSDYIPSAPVDDEAKKRNGSLPGMGGVFNYANLHVYHYAGNNPVKYTDPDGRDDEEYDAVKKAESLKTEPIRNENPLPRDLINRLVREEKWINISRDEEARNDAAKDIQEKVLDPRNEEYWHVEVVPVSEPYTSPERPRNESEGGNLRGEGGRPLPGMSESKDFHGTKYRVYSLPIERINGRLPPPVREYYDVDGNGRIDLERGRPRQ